MGSNLSTMGRIPQKVSPVLLGSVALVALAAFGFGMYTVISPLDSLTLLNEASEDAGTPTPYLSLGEQVYATAVPTPEQTVETAITKTDSDSQAAAEIPDSGDVLDKDGKDPLSENLDTGDLFSL